MDTQLARVIQILQEPEDQRLGKLEDFRDKVDEILSDYEDLSVNGWNRKYGEDLDVVLRKAMKGL